MYVTHQNSVMMSSAAGSASRSALRYPTPEHPSAVMAIPAKAKTTCVHHKGRQQRQAQRVQLVEHCTTHVAPFKETLDYFRPRRDGARAERSERENNRHQKIDGTECTHEDHGPYTVHRHVCEESFVLLRVMLLKLHEVAMWMISKNEETDTDGD